MTSSEHGHPLLYPLVFSRALLHDPMIVVLQLVLVVVSFPVCRTSAVLLAFFVGLFVPLLSNFLPIKRALSRTLRDSLDIYHQVHTETQVRMVKLANLGLSPWQIALSIMMIGETHWETQKGECLNDGMQKRRTTLMCCDGFSVMCDCVRVVSGFMVYYMIPYSFTFDNMRLFLSILTIILLGMVMGFCLVATAVQVSEREHPHERRRRSRRTWRLDG